VRNADHEVLEKAYYNGIRPRRVVEGYAIASAVVSAS
jgi:hypothetical protein